MNVRIEFILLGALLFSCGPETQQKNVPEIPKSIVGTWQLISGTIIEKGDTAVTDYTKNLSFIKIINDTHFAFLKHNLTTDSAAAYDSGGGRYALKDSVYTEHLDYYKDRKWEGNTFNFTIGIRNDTLTQTGIEKVEKAGINRLNIEKYVRLKN